ncbi:SDR family NAD(P)-dependent oxidoreductase [Fundicoccus culcitae]|uniref:SDR family oxidoreductase n=1 Tax=Fundicoccus culcitae TaxID=2969821 RepID=A0ABY5P7M9_9LACT|nr:SDR family oxidoreductase [Fundicoccus culcitae]UUX34606.1 SDR family oxidoreductase [Fundicoccus culcitae]
MTKIVLITGASSGIGRQVAIKAAEQGFSLILVARRMDRLTELANQLFKMYQTNVLVIKCDLTDSAQIERMVAKSIERFQRIDVLINCAGYGSFKSYDQFSYADYELMFKTNTLSMMYLSQLVAKQMELQKAGHIIIIASVAGKIATKSSTAYSATKFAMIGFANALRLELASKNIHVTTVNFGPVATEFFEHDSDSKSYYNKVKLMALDVDKAAQIISDQIDGKHLIQREINSPAYFGILSNLYQLFPRIGDSITRHLVNLK